MNILITLTMKEQFKFQIAQKLLEKKMTEEEARKLIGLKSTRQVRRIKKRVKEEGIQGVIHKSRGKPSNRKRDPQLISRAMSLIRERYHDFKPTFAAEKLAEGHGVNINKETLRQYMIKEELWKPRSRRKSKNHHKWRARKDNHGEMEQFDGSYHKWFEEREGGEYQCLLAAIDDATGKITKAKFDKNEGIHAVNTFWLEYFEENGLPISIYLDKFSTYKINYPNAVDNKELMTQFQRAMNQVGVQVIHAHSPEAKGRVERLFGTLQDRLVKELRLRNISTIKEANIFLKRYIKKFNKQFAVQPKNDVDLHKEVTKEMKKKFNQIFSIQSQRKVHNDYTISYKTRCFQLQEKQPTTVYKKDIVTIEEHLDGKIKINFRDKYLNYEELQEKPKKINSKVIALTRKESGWCPDIDHPWRKFKYSNKEINNNNNEKENLSLNKENMVPT